MGVEPGRDEYQLRLKSLQCGQEQLADGGAEHCAVGALRQRCRNIARMGLAATVWIERMTET